MSYFFNTYITFFLLEVGQNFCDALLFLYFCILKDLP